MTTGTPGSATHKQAVLLDRKSLFLFPFPKGMLSATIGLGGVPRLPTRGFEIAA
jgi:hypothetical protein